MRAVLVLGARMRAVVHIHQPRSVGPLTQRPVRSQRQAVHGEEGRGVVHARRLLTGLERGALDLQADDAAEVAHNGIYQNLVSCGSSSPMRVTLGWARCADNVADVLRRGAWYPIVAAKTAAERAGDRAFRAYGLSHRAQAALVAVDLGGPDGARPKEIATQ